MLGPVAPTLAREPTHTYMASTEGWQNRSLGKASLLPPSGPDSESLGKVLRTPPGRPNPSAWKNRDVE